MKNIAYLFIALMFTSISSTAQWDSIPTSKSKTGWIIAGTFTYDIPFADMADRFGNSYTFGGALMKKTEKNIYIQTFAEFIFGDKVRQTDMYRNLGWSDLQLYDFNGYLRNVELNELGMNIGVGVGKTLLLKKDKNLDNGINFMTSISLLQHRINHVDPDGALPQAIGDYAKGYDYLSNGLCLNQNISYIHFSQSSLTNFSVGLNFRFGFTKNRRSIDFATGVHDDALRSDFMIGFHFRWFIPLFSKLDTEVYF